MSLILRQVIGYQQGRRASALSADPELKKQLTESQKQLNSILNKWKFGDTPIRTSQEFLANFEPWINSQLEKQKELKLFLAKKGVNSLAEAETKLSNRDLSESAELEQIRQELTQLQATWNNTETDYLRQIRELKETQTSSLSEADQEKLAEHEDLITERDEAIREKRTLEQEVLALNNRLNLKQQEVQNKEKALEKLKRETSQKELTHQKQLKEKNTLITTLNQEIKQHKDKYSKQSKLLDTEQLECKRLEEENEKLQIKITQLETERRNLLEPQKTYQEWLSSGALNEEITEGSWSGYTYAYASEGDHSGFQDNPTNLTKKWKLKDLKEEIENNLPY